MSLEEDFNSQPLPQEITPAEKKWPIDVDKLSLEELDEIAERIKAKQLQLKQAAAGGGVPPEGPFDPVAEKDIAGWTTPQQAQTEMVPETSIAAMTAQVSAEADKVARERADRAVADTNAQIDANLVEEQLRRVSAQKSAETDTEKLDRMIAGNEAMIANNIAQQRMIDAANAEPAALSQPDPSIIPPQTHGPALEDPAIAQMRGVGSNWADAGQLARTLGTAAYEKTAAWLPHSPFGRFASRVERAGMRLMNAPQELAYSAMVRWRGEHATAAEVDYKNQEKIVKDMQASLKEKDTKRDAMIAEHAAKGLPTADIAMVLEGERAKVLKKIEKAQKQMDRAGKKLEDLNARKAGWAKKENDLAERTMAKIDQRLTPERGTFDALNVQKSEILKKLESLKRARDMGHQGLQELEAQLKTNPSLINNVAIPDKIAAVKELLGRIDDEFSLHTKAINRIDAKMRKANSYISDWMGYRNEEARVTSQDRRYFNPGQNIEDTAPHAAPTLTHAPTTPTQEAAA